MSHQYIKLGRGTKRQLSGIIIEEDVVPLITQQYSGNMLSGGLSGVVNVSDPNMKANLFTTMHILNFVLSFTAFKPPDTPDMDALLSTLKKVSKIRGED
jgi:hypothetical protein